MATKLAEIRHRWSERGPETGATGAPCDAAVAASPIIKDLLAVADAADQLLSAMYRSASADSIHGYAYTQAVLRGWTESEPNAVRLPAEQRHLKNALQNLVCALDWQAR